MTSETSKSLSPTNVQHITLKSLAFRLYGKFHWPPNASSAPIEPVNDDRIEQGVVEIHFIKLAGGDLYRSLLRWIPRPLLNELSDVEPDLPTQALFDFSADELTKWFNDHRGSGGTLWLDRSAASPINRTFLIFRGGFLFEQYLPASDGGVEKARIDIQWPLISRCEYDAGKHVYSVLGLHYHQKPFLYFNFHLPLPVRRTSRPGATTENSSFFPFSAVYDLTPATSEKLIKIVRLFGGWQKDDLLPKPDEDKDPSFAFEPENYPKEPRLGAFGFAEFDNRTGTDFARFNLPQPALNQLYWPLNKQALLQDVLWRYGFEIDYDRTGWLGPSNLGISDSSIRFRKPSPGKRGALIYRATVERNGDASEENDLQTVAGGGLRLRLFDELGGRRADRTQFGTGETFNDEKASIIEGWLRVGQKLHIDCELSWNIGDKWAEDRTADWSLTVTIRLHWQERISPDDVSAARAMPQPSGASGQNDFRAGLLAQANFTFDTARASLEPGEAGRPHSFLPNLTAAAAKDVRFVLYGSPLPAEFKDNVINWGRPAPTDENPSPPWRRPPVRLSLAHQDDVIEKIEDVSDQIRKSETLVLTGANLTFFQKEAPLELTLSHDGSWPPQSADAIEDGEPFFASFTAEALPQKKWEGRLGSLQFSGDKPEELEGAAVQRGHIRAGGRGARLGLGRGSPILTYPEGCIATEIRLAIPAAKVESIGVDVARGDRSGRPGPLLIPLDPKGSSTAAVNRFWLTATETLSPTHDRLLEATVTENSQETGDRSYAVLSSEPFSIFRFTHQPLNARGQADAATVAFYNGDDRIWQYRRVADFYHYVLPPQSIGESADKPRRLEIHDLEPGVSLETPPKPFVPDLDEHGNELTNQSGLRRRVVEYRLTPPAELWIRPSDVERGYFMPESNSFEIFRQPGQYGLGAALGYLRAEFLYGMSVGIDVSKERSIARGARVAEIEALTGKLTGPARENDAEAALKHRWAAVRSAVARRPERLEIWARDLDSGIDFTPARFSDGVQFALRHTALHRAPRIDPNPQKDEGLAESEKDFTSPPRIAGLLSSQVPAALQANPRHHPQGLSGGALWPVESLNLFRTLLQAPQSRGGAIESIALSPTGGDAAQKALFLGGKVTIISETRNGYVERLQVEVIGRICALWHRAKHVVVYERTVNPTAQFAPKFSEDTKRTRSRRPILRKVREYIELLQPERSYPDFSTAAQRSAGFLERVRFNSKIINVDSAWASEVGNYGWQIPLWNRLSARERPQVYPMPDIAFVSSAEGDGDKPVVAQECLDPDYLFFFADVSTDTTAETDMWQSRLGLDFPNMPAAQTIAIEADARSSDQPAEHGGFEKRRRAVGRILPGLRRFTWRLAPAAQKAAINAGRAEKPVYAGLDSVTFMRATHAATSSEKLPPRLADALAAAREIPEWQSGELKVSELGYWNENGEGSNVTGAADFNALKTALINSINAHNPTDLDAALTALDGFLAGGNFATKVAAIFPSPADLHLDKFKDISSAIVTGPSFCATLKADAVEMIQRKELLVRSALQDWVAEADDILKIEIFSPHPKHPDKPDEPAQTAKQNAINHLTEAAIDHIRPLFAEASKDVGRIEEGVEKSRAALIDLEVEIEAVIERARRRVREFVNGYDQSKPWSLERRRAFRAGLTASVSQLGDDIAAAIEETRQRLGVELNDASQAIGGHVAKALKAIAVVEADALERITTVQLDVDRLFARADTTLAHLLAATGDNTLDDVITKVQAASISPGLKTDAVNALQALKAACADGQVRITEVRAKAQKLDALAQEALIDVGSTVNALTDAVKATATALAQPAQDLVAFADDLANEGAGELAEAFRGLFAGLKGEIDAIADRGEKWVTALDSQLDAAVVPVVDFLDTALKQARDELHRIPAALVPIIDDVKQALQYSQDVLAPGQLLETSIKDQIVVPALTTVLAALENTVDLADVNAVDAALRRVRVQLDLLVEAVGDRMRNISGNVLDGLDQVTSACHAVFEGAAEAEAFLKALATDAEAYVHKQIGDAHKALTDKLKKAVGSFPSDVRDLLAAVKAFDYSVRSLQNDLSRTYETARVYGDRVFDQVSRLGEGGIMAAPSNILKLYSAVTSAPEIAALKADIDRIRSGFDELNDIIETTKANALFNRLGDELKALGLSLPFDKISDRLLPADLTDLDIAKVFRNFGGSKFDNLLKGYKLPAGVRDAVRVTHDFDKKQARAWVQVDIDAPMPGRRSLFSVGVFKADFVDMRLTGKVRLEASKDTDKVTETGYGRIGTVIDLVVGGQSMVRFEKFALNFSKEMGLDVEFDPKNIRLNPSFQYIQDFLSTLFPGEIGGLQVIKENGIPVGVQHDFAIPPISLNFATSGVSNISISNHFKLLAFPDFMLANRFNLSTVERPFIFSIFIIGGTGYIQIEAEYRPFDSELMVVVEAGAGGSASLAFAFGPFVGQVFITLSGALTYRKVIGKPGGGLSISAILVIAGHVDVAGIVTVGIVLIMRMTYRDNGQIDADGSLTVTVRISKFFKITARANVKYKMRGGKAETAVSTDTSIEVVDKKLKDKIDSVNAAAKKLEQARS